MRLRTTWLAAMAFAIAIPVLGGDTPAVAPATPAPGLTQTRDRVGRVVVPDEPRLGELSGTRADRPERPELSRDVTLRIEQFKREARAYLEQQEALRKKLLGANDTDRAQIREQLQTLRLQWLERSRELRETFKDRQAELRSKLQGREELLDDARNAAREQIRDARGNVHRRRGE